MCHVRHFPALAVRCGHETEFFHQHLSLGVQENEPQEASKPCSVPTSMVGTDDRLTLMPGIEDGRAVAGMNP